MKISKNKIVNQIHQKLLKGYYANELLNVLKVE
jgi:hypothetical protein